MRKQFEAFGLQFLKAKNMTAEYYPEYLLFLPGITL